MTEPKSLLGGVEFGGTKCICFVCTAPDDIREQLSIPTGSEPLTALRRIVDLLHHWQSHHGRIAALEIASFGPVDLVTRSSTFGFITSTSKCGWRFVDVAGHLSQAFFLTAEGRAGHFGLHGMHERARLIGGKLTV
jgi:fructokinase